MRIVVCDDDRLLLESLARALELKGFMVEAATSTPQEAVAAVRRLRPDVLLIDLGFPEGDGLDAARQVRRDHPETYVVILTASEEPASLLEADKLGLAGYVGKDQRLDAIVEALRRAAQGEGRVDKTLLRRLGGTGGDTSGRTSVLDKLTAQERVVLGCLGDGLSTSEIVARLGISHTTVRSHIQAILVKLGVHSRLQAVAVLRDGDGGRRAVGQ
ncbi:MAG TPA: response regulator transcription factor [Nocardioides sp.]|nr:response regulator transcription factor [Nocardioides sp.]